MPIDCVVGQTCIIQNYVDRDPGPGATDFRCGHLSYDGHKGTDFRVVDVAALRRGVPVIAAAGGTVVGARNNMADVNVRRVGVAALKGKDCGNGVRIDHGGGYSSQYCHLRQGSVRVRRGDHVRAGERLGVVGLSGRTEFPHLHFEITRRGRPIDPFVGPGRAAGCRVAERPIWRDAQRHGLSYRGVGLIDAGFSIEVPKRAKLDEGRGVVAEVRNDARALVFWVRVFGLRPGDRQQLTVRRPDGSLLVRSTPKSVDRPKAVWLSYSGKRRPKQGAWSAGTYRGSFALVRNGKRLVSVERTLEVR